jgi:ubiquinone/menaquinone biosynthesis C-methylase UbiE
MKPTKAEVSHQFDRMSHAYASSSVHAAGDDLAVLLDYVRPQPEMRVLDVATGAGHTAAAVAPSVAEVVAIDIAPAMLERTRELAAKRGLLNLRTALMDVEALGYPDESFDVVTCRIAPHHFLDIDRAIGEIARVLREGGAFVVEDSVVPEDAALDRFFNDIEKIRDATHVRSLTVPEWTSKLQNAGLTPIASTNCPKAHDIPDWIARAGLDEAGTARVYAALAAASDDAIRRFAIEFEGGRAVRYTDDKIVIRAEKTPRR